MLFLAFLHKIAPNCKVGDSKNAPKVPCLRGVLVVFYNQLTNIATLTGGHTASRQVFLQMSAAEVDDGDNEYQVQQDVCQV